MALADPGYRDHLGYRPGIGYRDISAIISAVMDSIPDNDKEMVCPFDKNHRLVSVRMLNHISKCEKKHKHLGLVPCRYTRLHWISENEKALHESECKDKECFSQYACQQDSLDTPSYEVWNLPEDSSECWDGEKQQDPHEFKKCKRDGGARAGDRQGTAESPHVALTGNGTMILS